MYTHYMNQIYVHKSLPLLKEYAIARQSETQDPFPTLSDTQAGRDIETCD